MKKIAATILNAMIKSAAESYNGWGAYFTRDEICEMTLMSGRGWTNRAVTHLMASGMIAMAGEFFVLTRKGSEGMA